MIVAVVVFAVIGSMGSNDDVDNNDPNASKPDDTEAQAPTVDKETAESNDLIIYQSLKQAFNYFDVLNTALSELESGDSNLLDIYNTCSDMKDYLSQFSDHVDEVNDESAEDYKDAVKGYIGNIRLVADDIIDFIDSGEMGSLSSAQEGIQLIPTFQQRADDARVAYLKSAGFSDDEISEMTAN